MTASGREPARRTAGNRPVRPAEDERAVRRRPRLELARSSPAFDFLESKIHVPELRPGTVPRTGLVNRLRAATTAQAATLVAPAGYGKTTLLAQWAERDPRPFTWVTLDQRDNDPLVLLRQIAAALSSQTPLQPRVVAALRSPGSSLWDAALPRLAAALTARSPIVFVLDDFHHLRSRASLEAVSALIGEEVEGSLLVVSGRTVPRLPLAPLRAAGRLFELGAEDLALHRREAQRLLSATGARLDKARTTQVIEQCEGWPAALQLAAASISDGRQSGREPIRFGGDDRYVADYLRSEYLAHLRPGPLRFLRRTSVLRRMSGDLCDAVLEDEGSAHELEKIERANLFLVPLDNRREWYRFHHLFRELLEVELAAREPELLPVLHGRAADWYQAHGDDASALEHAYGAGDVSRAADILAGVALRVSSTAAVETLERWFRRFEEDGLVERFPDVALLGCRLHLLRGRAQDAARWLEAAQRSPTSVGPRRPVIATLRAFMCRSGPEQMRTDAEGALEELPHSSPWRAGALLAQGVAHRLLGEDESADDVLAAAATSAAAQDSIDIQLLALGERALLLADRGGDARAEEVSGEADELSRAAGFEEDALGAIERAARARILLRSGRWNEARAVVTAAQGGLNKLTTALPWLSVRTRLELSRALVALRDVARARELLDEAGAILRLRGDLGVLAAAAEELERELGARPTPAGTSPAGLTAAELRLLPLLASHLSFREIAEELYVSRNTIKTQAISIYRKLGASSRSEAITEAHRLGLGDHLRVLVSSGRWASSSSGGDAPSPAGD